MTARLAYTVLSVLAVPLLHGCGVARPPAELTEPPPAPRVAPYGAWESPVGADRLAAASIRLSDLQVFDGRAYWRESRPEERGRNVVVPRNGTTPPQELSDGRFSVRTRVHEYGGASYLRVGEDLVFSNFADQRLYLQRHGAEPVALTPPGYQYADCVQHPTAPRLVCVREDHTPATVRANGEERNEIVTIPLPAGAPGGDTPGEVLVTGSDFVAYPRVSPDGRQLAWLAWNHPDMPWDTTLLHVAPLTAAGLGEAVQVAGGPDEAALEPQWDADGTLYFISDPSGWWNLYRWRDGTVDAVAPIEREFGGPLWRHGASTYALTGDGRAVVRTSLAAIDELGVLDLESGELRRLELPYVSFPAVRLVDDSTAVAIAGSATNLEAVITVDLDEGAHRVLHRPVEAELDAAWIPPAQTIEFPTQPGPDGEPRTAHAFFYPPTNPHFQGPDGRRPPLLVMVHGGPTSVARPDHSMLRMYWSSRGFAVVDVNYGGSTTFGRDYRRRLNGQWGIVDVADAVAAVDHLVATGRVDGERVAIRGGSAGGYTALAALAFTDRFVAAANYYGVSDIKRLAETSHKFERNYDVSLIGPQDEALYRARSPLSHLEAFNAPLITFQGSEDRIVVPEQSRMIVAALRERGIPSAYLEFEGEQHGFRQAENIIRAAEAELYFFGRVFGFTPAGELPPVEIVPELPQG
jgi:dipeptidyl aminopeptidase/acylaminoacyl peptidase